MIRRAAVIAIVAATLASAGQAMADPYRRFRHERQGAMVGLALGSSLFSGIDGTGEDVGVVLGAGMSLRVGTTAAKHWLWTLQLDADSYLVRNTVGTTRANSVTLLSLGVQYYLREVFWIRGGLGIARLSWRDKQSQGGFGNLGGGALAAGVGYDLYRRESFVVAAESFLALGSFRDPARDREPAGAARHVSMRLSLSWY